MRLLVAIQLWAANLHPALLNETPTREKFLPENFARLGGLALQPLALGLLASLGTRARAAWAVCSSYLSRGLLLGAPLASYAAFHVLSFFVFSLSFSILFDLHDFLTIVEAWVAAHTFSYLLFMGFVYFFGRTEYVGSVPALSRF